MWELGMGGEHCSCRNWTGGEHCSCRNWLGIWTLFMQELVGCVWTLYMQELGMGVNSVHAGTCWRVVVAMKGYWRWGGGGGEGGHRAESHWVGSNWGSETRFLKTKIRTSIECLKVRKRKKGRERRERKGIQICLFCNSVSTPFPVQVLPLFYVRCKPSCSRVAFPLFAHNLVAAKVLMNRW